MRNLLPEFLFSYRLIKKTQETIIFFGLGIVVLYNAVEFFESKELASPAGKKGLDPVSAFLFEVPDDV